jgi:hypothetical protein
MTKSILLLSSAALGIALASPASADVIQVDPSSIQGSVVLFTGGQQSGNSVNGQLNNAANTGVTFTGTGGAILRAQGGQSQITGDLDASTPQPNDTIQLNGLTFGLTNNSLFNNVEFSLFKGTATSVNISVVDDAGQIFSFANLALGNGENQFGFQAINGESIRSVTFATNGGGVLDLRQVRLDLANNAPVPEPAAWALMLAGFGVIGSALRRRTRTSVTFHA